MKTLLRYVCMLLALGYGIVANAQDTTLELDNMTQVGNYSPMRWRYGTVTCNSGNSITSIIVSMVNNDIHSNSSIVTPTGNPNVSIGVNPKTILYLFTPAITETEVEDFIKGMTFVRTSPTETQGMNPRVDITIDANPTKLPPGATITVWRDHPDGSTHYYVWVASPGIDYGPAYSDAKSYYFQGMRGYMPTITSKYESELLTEISKLQGWSGGARTTATISDTRQSIANPPHSNSGEGIYYRWLCGPETDFKYYQGPRYNSTNGGVMNNAFSGWNPTEPNDSDSENCMQVNHTNYAWNDYYAWNNNIQGYFIEFGGNGKKYTVRNNLNKDAVYPENPKYHMPTAPTGPNNDQWYNFSPGNRASTSTTFKPNSMRSNVLVIE